MRQVTLGRGGDGDLRLRLSPVTSMGRGRYCSDHNSDKPSKLTGGPGGPSGPGGPGTWKPKGDC